MKYLLLILSLLFGNTTFCQSTKNSEKFINISLNGIHEEPDFSYFKSNNVRIRPGVGILFINSNLFSHEFEIRELWYRSQSKQTVNSNGLVTSGFEQKNFYSALRYSFGKAIKAKNERLRYNLSIGVMGEYKIQYNLPLTSNFFDHNTSRLSFFTEFIPNISFLTKNKNLLKLSVPLKIYSVSKRTQEVLNPALSEDDQRKASGNLTSWFPSIFELKLSYGFGLKK